MSDIYSGKQTKLSKTMGSPLDTMGEIFSSRCPSCEWNEVPKCNGMQVSQLINRSN